MKPTIQPDDLQQAWQTAFHLRTCPDDKTLRRAEPDEHLSRHLNLCPICREKRAMPAEQVDAWQNLFAKFAQRIHRAECPPLPGQVWVLKKSLARWGDDGYFYSPPNVLIIEEDGAKCFHVVQLYFDKRLMCENDVWLGDKFGFAQGWNIYTIRQDALECCLGSATDDQVAEVIRAEAMNYAPPEENSILWYFRGLEKTVGICFALPPAIVPAEATENESFLQQILGPLAAVYEKLSKFNLPEFADSLIELLSGVADPQAIIPVTASTRANLPVNIVIKHADGAITIKTVAAVLSEDNWEDGDYYVAGKLHEVQGEELFLVASLNMDGMVVQECRGRIEKGSPYFDITFKSVAKAESRIENLKFILVRP